MKIGDKVRCIDNEPCYVYKLTIGKIYTVEDINNYDEKIGKVILISVKSDQGISFIVFADRFEPVKETETPLDVVKRLFLESTSFAYQNAYDKVLREAFGVTPVKETVWIFKENKDV